jgi:hypothetical protein
MEKSDFTRSQHRGYMINASIHMLHLRHYMKDFILLSALHVALKAQRMWELVINHRHGRRHSQHTVRYYPSTVDNSVSIVTTAMGCTIGGLIPGWVKRLFSSRKYPDQLWDHPAFHSIGLGLLFHGWGLSSKSRNWSSSPTSAHIKTHSSCTAALPSHPSHPHHHAHKLHLYHHPSTGTDQRKLRNTWSKTWNYDLPNKMHS